MHIATFVKRVTRIGLLVGGIMTATGCATRFPHLTEPDAEYRAALRAPVGHRFAQPQQEQAALERVMNLFRDFSPENLRRQTRAVYADTLYFRDGFRLVRDIDALDAYFQHSAEPLRSCAFVFADPVQDRGDYFLRWTMSVNLKRDPEDRVEQVIGMSHIRFDEEGKVVFQQDYWDPTDVLYRRIPVANRLIGYVRSRL